MSITIQPDLAGPMTLHFSNLALWSTFTTLFQFCLDIKVSLFSRLILSFLRHFARSIDAFFC